MVTSERITAGAYREAHSGRLPAARTSPEEAEIQPADIDTDFGDNARTPTARPGRTRHLGLGIALVLVTVAPLLAAAIVDHGHYSPLGDEALIDLHVRDVLSLHLPLLGPYSRYGFNHPGPALYYLLAPFSAVTGKSAWGTMAGGPLLQALAVAGIAWVTWRRGSWKMLAAAMAATAVAYSTKPAALFLEPWSPYIPYPYLLLLAFTVWSVASGDAVQLVLATAVASFLVQTHVGYAPFVLACLVFLGLTVGRDVLRRRLAGEHWRRTLVWSAVVAVVMWTPPLVQQFTDGDGNLTRMFDYFTGPGTGPRLGLSRGVERVANDFRLPPPWLVPDHGDRVFVHGASILWLLVPCVLLVAGALAARATRVARDSRMVGLATLLLLSSVVAFSGVEPPVFEYLVLWRVPVAVFVWFASAWAIARWIVRRTDQRAVVALGTVAIVLTVGCSASSLVRVVDHGRPITPWASAPVLLADALTGGKPVRQSVLIYQIGGGFSGVGQGLVDELDRRGVDARIDPRGTTAEIDRRAATPKEVDQIWYLVTEPHVDDYAARPGAQVLTRLSPLGPQEDRELRDLQQWFLSETEAHGRQSADALVDSADVSPQDVRIPGIDREKLDRLRELNRKVAVADRCRCAVVAVDARDAGP
jgi:hypothetical protein